MSLVLMEPQNRKYLGDYTDQFPRRQNNYDFLRVVAALLVVLSHSFLIADNSLDNDFLTVLTHGQSNLGRVGLFIFFVLSGFLITSSYDRLKNPIIFLKNRFLRIMPGFLCIVLFSVFMLGPLFTSLSVWTYLGRGETYQYLLNLTLVKWDDYLPGVFQQTHAKGYINGSLWSIRFEVYCYLFVCILGMLNLLRRQTAIFLFAGICISNILFSTLWNHVSTTHGPLYFLKTFSSLGSYFSVGMLFYLYRHSILLDNKWLLSLALLAVFLPFYVSVPEWVLLFPAAYLIFSFAYSSNIRLHGVSKIGDLSYGIYIYAWPVQQIMYQWLGRNANWLTIFSASLPVVAVLALLSWHLIEKRSLQLKIRHAQ